MRTTTQGSNLHAVTSASRHIPSEEAMRPRSTAAGCVDIELGRPVGFRGEFLLAESARSGFAGAAGILHRVPGAVAIPRDADDLVTLVRECARTNTPLVPRAAATGMPGGNLGRGVVVDLLSPFRRILELNAKGRIATVEPGVTLAELNAAAAPSGLQFPVDPSSGERCTLGGMIANNAAGAHSVRYGATRSWVEALEVVLADGTRAELRRGCLPSDPTLRRILAAVEESVLPDREAILRAWPAVRKNSSGYGLREYLESGDAVDLLVGSEGTLALFVVAELRMAPRPRLRALARLEFTDLVDAGAAASRLLDLEPATCEILDRTFLDLVRSADPDLDDQLPPNLEAVLLVEVEANSKPALDRALARLERGITGIASNISIATDEEQQRRFWEIRHAASPIIARRADRRVSMQFIEDGVVPVERLPDYILALRRVLDENDVPAVIFGHAGDGNLHVNPLIDVGNPGWRQTIDTILFAIASEVRALGGTLAGEHGDGRLRAPLLETIWGPQMIERFRQVKRAFDPYGILNPGVILPLPGQRPLDGLREFPAPEGAPARSPRSG